MIKKFKKIIALILMITTLSSCVTLHLDKDSEGKGIMSEALKSSLACVFDEYKLHRVEAFILPENERSIRLVERVGFTYEGHRKSYMHINGKYRDHEAFYILEDDM